VKNPRLNGRAGVGICASVAKKHVQVALKLDPIALIRVSLSAGFLGPLPIIWQNVAIEIARPFLRQGNK